MGYRIVDFLDGSAEIDGLNSRTSGRLKAYPPVARLRPYLRVTASCTDVQWRTRFGRAHTNCFNGVSMS